jgi:enoyl-CoA hydratase/carnithine racemase
MSKTIDVSTNDRIQTVRLNRPDKKNALDLAMYTALAEAVRGADRDPAVRVTLLTGTGDAFCSGNDIKDFVNNPPTDDSSPVIRFIEAILHAEKPIVAAVNGIAVGIGTTMLLHCDLVYAADSARFQLPFVNIGLAPEAASTLLLPMMMGQQRASELLLLGGMFSAAEAYRVGIVNAVVPAAELEKTALQSAQRIAAQPPASVRTTKALLRSSVRELVEAASQREIGKFVPMLNAPEAREALTAFLEKRKPDFSKF